MNWNLNLEEAPEPADGEDFGPVFALAVFPADDPSKQSVMFARLAWFTEVTKPSPFDGRGGGEERVLAPQCTVTGNRLGKHLEPYAWAPLSDFTPPDPAAF